jgi:hypothetical protein
MPELRMVRMHYSVPISAITIAASTHRPTTRALAWGGLPAPRLHPHPRLQQEIELRLGDIEPRLLQRDPRMPRLLDDVGVTSARFLLAYLVAQSAPIDGEDDGQTREPGKKGVHIRNKWWRRRPPFSLPY